jgi:hypothetical protein
VSHRVVVIDDLFQPLTVRSLIVPNRFAMAPMTRQASPDIWKSIFWLQHRPAEPSAEVAYAHGRKGYLIEIQSQLMPATRPYNELTG